MDTDTDRPIRFRVPVVCPLCRQPLRSRGSYIACPPCERPSCPRRFEYESGIPDLVVGGRFDDAQDEARAACEAESTRHSVESYWIPQLRALTRSVEGRPRVLSVGCGAGQDVDLLSRAGFDCVGIDCGQRAKAWPERESREALLLANGMNLPFPDHTFDAAYCGCVFPHVGVVRDTFAVTERCDSDRRAMASEMTRVVRPGGHIIVTSPNRYFPFDLFHGRESGSYRIRPYWPGDRFLLSVEDYSRLFLAAGCRGVETLPVSGYWGFLRSRHTLKGFVLGLPVRLIFWLVDQPWLRFLRRSPLTPWIAVLAKR